MTIFDKLNLVIFTSQAGSFVFAHDAEYFLVKLLNVNWLISRCGGDFAVHHTVLELDAQSWSDFNTLHLLYLYAFLYLLHHCFLEEF